MTEKQRERESTLATCTYPTEKVASWVTDYLALKIVVHSVGGSGHLLGVELNLRKQLPTVAFFFFFSFD